MFAFIPIQFAALRKVPMKSSVYVIAAGAVLIANSAVHAQAKPITIPFKADRPQELLCIQLSLPQEYAKVTHVEVQASGPQKTNIPKVTGQLTAPSITSETWPA